MVARPFSFMKTACTQSFLTPRSQSDLLNGSQFNGALWVPPASQEPSYQVLPVTWMARRPAFWLHIEGDSELARAEKEELISLFNGGDVGRVLGHPVICIGLLRENANGEPLDALYMKGRGACGDKTSLQVPHCMPLFVSCCSPRSCGLCKQTGYMSHE